MPRSRQRKSTSDPLKPAKNAARGTRDSIAAISRARQLAPESQIGNLADWTSRSYRTSKLICGLRPNTIQLLHPTGYLEPTSLGKELSWAIACLQPYSSAINRFIEAKNKISIALLDGNLDVILNILDDVDSFAGISLFGISLRISVIQLLKGLEAQKSYTSTIRRSNASKGVKFYAYWWSVRAEDSSNVETFKRDIESKSQSWNISESHKALIFYHLLHEIPEDGREADLLAASASTSIIDYYETAISLLTSAFAEDRVSKSQFGKFAEQLSTFSTDCRLLKISLIGGNCTRSNQIPIGQSYYSDLFANDSVGSHNGSTYDLEEVKSSASIGTLPSNLENAFGLKIWNGVSLLMGFDHLRSGGIIEVSRLGLLLDNIELGSWSRELYLSESGPRATPARAHEVARFVATPELNSLIVPYLADDAAIEISHILESNGWREALIAARATRSGSPLASPDFDRLSPRTAIEVLLKSDPTPENLQCVIDTSRTLRLSGRIYRRALMSEIEALIAIGEIKEAICTFAQIAIGSPDKTDMLPIVAMRETLSQDLMTEHHNIIYTPIVLDFLVKAGASELAPSRFYAVEDYMLSVGAEKPTDMQINVDETDQDAIIYFLSELCTPSVLKLSIAYATFKELQDERLQLCRKLVFLDPNHSEKYEQEARDIIRSRLIQTALDEVQRSKITLDEPALRQWATWNIKRDFERYVALLASGVVVVNDEFMKDLYAAMEAGDLAKIGLEIPDNEATSLFVSAVSRFLQECALSQEHGLDSYLSVRIRHGTISGAIRGSVEAEHLVTRKASGSNSYKRNEYWSDIYQSSLDPRQLSELNEKLSSFSRSIDALISDLTDNYIQIYRDEKIKGIFNLTLSRQSIFALASNVVADTDFEKFLDLCFDYFWQLVSTSLEKVRSHILGQFKNDIRQKFSELETSLRVVLAANRSTEIIDALRRAQTETMHALDRMADWFTMPTPLASLPLELNDLLEMGLSTVRSFYPDFDPIINYDCENVPPLRGVHGLFADVFFILFENIMSRSGNDKNPVVTVSAWIEEDWLMTRVDSEVVPDEVYSGRIARGVDTARAKISTGTYKSAVRHEGGSGLPKLVKLLQIDHTDQRFKFGLDDAQEKFSIQFPLRVIKKYRSQ